MTANMSVLFDINANAMVWTFQSQVEKYLTDAGEQTLQTCPIAQSPIPVALSHHIEFTPLPSRF